MDTMFYVANFLYRIFVSGGMVLISIKIGDAEINLSDVNESLINQQINRRRRDGIDVCIKVEIHEDDLNLILSTPSCQKAAGGCRPPNKHERMVFELWDKFGLNTNNFTGGKLIAFLKQLRNLI